MESTEKNFNITIEGGEGKWGRRQCEKCLRVKRSHKYSYSVIKCFVGVLILFISTLETVSCDPISGSSSASSGSSGTGGTWSIRAIPHQSNTGGGGYTSTLYEEVQNLKYNWETSAEHLMRKIEALESKIGRLETSNQLRLEKLTESVNSKEIKDELAMEQLMRKLDANYERINHKIGFMENRLDGTLNKIQTNMESGFNRIEMRQNDIDTEFNDLSQSVEEIKVLTIQIDEKQNTTQKSVQQHLQTITSDSVSYSQIEKLTGTLHQISVKLNDTSYPINMQNQNDASGQSDAEKIIEVLKTEVDRESHRIENKISNMYNDLWRRIISLEVTVKTGLTLGNTTRKIVQEDFKAVLQQHEKQRNAEPDSQENYIEIVMDAMITTTQDLSRKVDSNFQMIIASQNLFMENCHRLQLDEPQLESKISMVLEKILNTITNKTMRVDNRLVETMEMIKSHQSQVMRSLGHTTKMVVTLTEGTSQDAKNMESALLELAERSTIVAMAIQELQDDVEMLTNVTSLKLNNEIEEWFNKSMNENYYDNEEAINKTIKMEKETSDKPTISTIQITMQSTTQMPETNNQDNNNAKKNINYKNIKYADSDEVIKIFTEDDDFNTDMNKSESENKGREKKISIVIPDKYYDNFENNKNMTNKTKLYRILLHDLLNQTGQLNNVDNIDAIILNTESDDNNNNRSNEKQINTTKPLLNDDLTNNQSRLENNQTKLENRNPSAIKNDSSEIIENNATTEVTDKTNEDDKSINVGNKINSTISTKIQNITEIMKSKFDSYRNQKYKNNDNGKGNNKGIVQLLHYRSQKYNNTNNENLKKFIERYNKKQKPRNQSKPLNILTTETQNRSERNDNQRSQNIGNENYNKLLPKDALLIGEKIPENEKQFENVSTETKETEYPIGTDNEDENDEITSPITGDDTIEDNNEDNFYSEIKYPYLYPDLSSLHGSDMKEHFPDYDNSKQS